MEQQTFTSNAAASLTAQGQTQASGSITWTAPTLPEDAASWDSITISGSWSWSGKGSISRVTINGTNTSDGVTFNIPLSVSQTSPLSISCVGNKNASGSGFTWSNLLVTYVCTVQGGAQLSIKVNGTWTPVSAVYRKVNGTWVEQADLSSVFDTEANYLKSV